MILIYPDRTPTLICALTALWETSVRATHYPLSFLKLPEIFGFVRSVFLFYSLSLSQT